MFDWLAHGVGKRLIPFPNADVGTSAVVVVAVVVDDM